MGNPSAGAAAQESARPPQTKTSLSVQTVIGAVTRGWRRAPSTRSPRSGHRVEERSIAASTSSRTAEAGPTPDEELVACPGVARRAAPEGRIRGERPPQPTIGRGDGEEQAAATAQRSPAAKVRRPITAKSYHRGTSRRRTGAAPSRQPAPPPANPAPTMTTGKNSSSRISPSLASASSCASTSTSPSRTGRWRATSGSGSRRRASLSRSTTWAPRASTRSDRPSPRPARPREPDSRPPAGLRFFEKARSLQAPSSTHLPARCAWRARCSSRPTK